MTCAHGLNGAWATKWSSDQCRVCWSAGTFTGAATSKKTRFKLPSFPPRPPRLIALPRTDCIELGAFVHRTSCGTMVHKCALHGTCTTNKKKGITPCCLSCDDYETEEKPGPRRHLLYFIFPVASNDIWKRNVDEIHKRLPLFNGRRVVAISTSDGLVSRGFKLDSPDTVMKYFGKEADFLVVPTVKRLRRSGKVKELKLGEVAAFTSLLERVKPFQREDDYTFYAHAKGVTKPPETTVFRWAQLMYKVNLDHWDRVHDALKSHVMAGAFRWVSPIGFSTFHYHGTYWWFRNRDFVTRDWQTIVPKYGGVEWLPGQVCKPEESANLFGHERPWLYHEDQMARAESDYLAWAS